MNLNNNFLYMYTGNLVDFFTLHVLKSISSVFGINNINVNLNINLDLRKYFIFNNNVKTFELNNVFLILGTNPKVDSPILNMKIRNIKYKYNQKIYICYIGSKLLINYKLLHLGINSISLLNMLYGKNFFCKIFKSVYNIICLYSIGFNLVLNNYLLLTLDTLSFFLKNQNFIYNYISLFSSDVSLYELGITSYYFTKSIFINNSKPSMLYLLGVDYNNMLLKNCNNNKFTIYHGHHGNTGLYNSNIIIPSNLYIENTCFFLNCEGRFFVSNVAITKKRKTNNNESILYNLFNFLFNKKKSNKYLKRIFILFFYKNSFFFTKYKFINKINLSILKTFSNINLFYTKCLFTVKNSFFNMDVFSKSSYYILKIKEKERLYNFL